MKWERSRLGRVDLTEHLIRVGREEDQLISSKGGGDVLLHAVDLPLAHDVGACRLVYGQAGWRAGSEPGEVQRDRLDGATVEAPASRELAAQALLLLGIHVVAIREVQRDAQPVVVRLVDTFCLRHLFVV